MTMTQQHKQKISKAMKGKKKSQDHKAKISKAMTGNQNATGHQAFQDIRGEYKGSRYVAGAIRGSDLTWMLSIWFEQERDSRRYIPAKSFDGARVVTNKRLEEAYQAVQSRLLG